MIVRILEEGQYELPDSAMAALDKLDVDLSAAMVADDEAAFDAALNALLQAVRSTGTPLDAATIVPSELTLPHQGATLAELKDLLASEPAESAPEGV